MLNTWWWDHWPDIGEKIEIYHHYLCQNGFQWIKRFKIKSNSVKAKENIAILKSYIGVGKAKARYITPKPQRLRVMITLKFKIINSKNKTKVLGKCNERKVKLLASQKHSDKSMSEEQTLFHLPKGGNHMVRHLAKKNCKWISICTNAHSKSKKFYLKL